VDSEQPTRRVLGPKPLVITITDSLPSVREGVRPEDYCMMVETCRGYAKGFIYYLRLIVHIFYQLFETSGELTRSLIHSVACATKNILMLGSLLYCQWNS